jgi:hypothetical protein
MDVARLLLEKLSPLDLENFLKMTVSVHFVIDGLMDSNYIWHTGVKFLAHLSQRLNLAIVIVICLSFYVINIKEHFFNFYFLFLKGEGGDFNTSSQSHDG